MAITAFYKGLLLGCLVVGIFAQDVAEKETAEKLEEEIPLPESRLLQEKIAADQAASAVYSFATSIVDGIMDNMQLRSETRDGLKLEGSYSYSDGFFKRTVNYVADENGYRVESEVVEPLGDGPKVNLDGKADVHTSIGGQETDYSITKADIAQFKSKPEVKASA